MKRGSFGRQVIGLFLAVVIGYFLVFQFIQNRRVTKGPWQVTFTVENSKPALIINEPKLGLRDVRIIFSHGISTGATNLPQTLEFSQARRTPFDVPFGKCVFLDPVFLPGTVALEMFGHEIQLMPRVLTIDKTEHAWKSGETITLGLPTAVTNPAARTSP